MEGHEVEQKFLELRILKSIKHCVFKAVHIRSRRRLFVVSL